MTTHASAEPAGEHASGLDILIGEAPAATDAIVADICALFEVGFGPGWYPHHDIAATIDDPQSLCVIAMRNGAIIGAATGHLLDRDQIPEQFPAGQAHHARRLAGLDGLERVCMLEASVVAPEYRGLGVATGLILMRERLSRARGARGAFVFAWRSPAGCHIGGALARCGYVREGTLLGFWTRESREAGLVCCACGPVCSCAAVLHTKRYGA